MENDTLIEQRETSTGTIYQLFLEEATGEHRVLVKYNDGGTDDRYFSVRLGDKKWLAEDILSLIIKAYEDGVDRI